MDLERLAEATRNEMEVRGWSFRKAQGVVGRSFTSIERMSKGVLVESDTIIAFALAIAPEGKRIQTACDWLRMGGKDAIANLLEEALRQGALQNASNNGEASTQADDPDIQYLLLLYARAKPSQRRVVRSVLEELVMGG